MAVVRVGWLMRERAQTVTRPTATPMPMAAKAKSPAISTKLNEPAMAATAERRRTSAVASLTSQPLPLEDRDELGRQPQALPDRCSGDGVWRAHHRAKGDRGRERQAGEQPREQEPDDHR